MLLFFLKNAAEKKVFALLFSCALFQSAFPQSDSVFTAGLPANNMMKLQNDGGFVVRGNLNTSFAGLAPQQGSGTRLVWFPQKAALRAGYISGTQWDNLNVGNYSVAFGQDCRASADNSFAMGYGCTATQISSLAIGESNTASGAASVALGYHAHTNARQGSFVFADRSTTDTLRAGTNHSANWRVSNGFRIYTASTLSTGVTIQSGVSVSNWGQSGAVISTSTGAMLSTGGVWQNASDINKKHLFRDISNEEILQKLNSIAIREWGYKTEPGNVRHIGPTAQDFSKAFSLGTDELSIGTVDADGVALACIQALTKRTEDQAMELEALKNANSLLNERMKKLELKDGMNLSGISSGLTPLALVPIAALALVWYRRKQPKHAAQDT